MTTILSQRVLDAIHPFSFVTNSVGRLSLIGRALRKVHPRLESQILFGDVLLLEQPSIGFSGNTLADLVGELVVLSPRDAPGIKLRGQVVPLDVEAETYFFVLTPTLTDMYQINSVGLQFADFPVADPVFDFLLFIQSQRIAREMLQHANANLQWEYKVSKLLHELAVRTYHLHDADRAYAVVVSAVCEALHWDIAHVYINTGGKEPYLRSALAWYVSDPSRYGALQERTDLIRFARGEGLPGRAWERESVVWLADVKRDPQFSRRDSLSESPCLTGVAVPIIVEGAVAAVLEFFTESPPLNHENLARFFELLALQLGSVITRQRVNMREKEQLAALVSASKMAALGEIAAGVAHEINNPVSSISLTAHLITTLANSSILDAEAVQTHTSRIKTCVKRISTIVSELRDFSRDSTSDPFSSIPIRKIIDETLDLCSARFGSKGIKLELGDVPAEWRIDCRASQISQVLLNLLNNACDAVDGLDSRWVRLEGRDLGGSIEISVTDSGRGIDSDVRERIMTPFFTTKPPGVGTGLGLSISSNILTDHGGVLRLDTGSENTRFIIVIPKRQVDHASYGSPDAGPTQ
jgi:C4-dicarboxylate-specific signal transduction histidine kinase